MGEASKGNDRGGYFISLEKEKGTERMTGAGASLK